MCARDLLLWFPVGLNGTPRLFCTDVRVKLFLCKGQLLKSSCLFIPQPGPPAWVKQWRPM